MSSISGTAAPVLSVRDLVTEVATPEGRRVVVDFEQDPAGFSLPMFRLAGENTR